LTGETGAGKSILVEAVGLLLGGRSSADLIRTGESHAVIEAMFEHDGDEVVVRRELTSHGRSRSFINGTLATAGALRDLSARLAELHGQHEHQALLDPLTHLSVLDEYADLAPLIERVGAAWAELRTIRDQVDRSRMDARERSARLELVAFQLGEIEKVAPRAGEDEALKVRREVLASAERIQRLCQESYAALYERDEAALATLGGVWKRVGELATLDPQFLPYIDARDGIKAQLEDLALFLRGYADGVDASPGRLQEVEERLALLDRLKRKYGPRLEDVLARGRALACERDQLGGAGARTEDLLRLLQQAERQYLDVARELSARRHEAAGRFGQRIEAMLAELAMERTRFEVRFDDGETRADQWGERGLDRAEFYLSPNLGEEMRPLARIVSGGELSRIMLALKTLAVGDAPHKTLIFDEVDAGIGGRVAEVVGRRLRELGDRFQVLCITHLPQIAARGEAHFRIEKQARGGRTTTSVARLADAERVDEIARMIAGARVTDAVQVTAYDLLRVRPAAKAKGESERRKR
jgi:DNA repair protein RecN (Recombination protein N)